MKELAIDYTKCIKDAPLTNPDPTDPASVRADIPPGSVSSTFKSATVPQWGRAKANYTWPRTGVTNQDVDVCILSFEFPENVKPPILFYYRLTNFYQNHRRYVKSLDIDQLKGKARDAAAIRGGDCDPLRVGPGDKPYYPCGLIANSMFNDTFDNLTFANPQGSQGDAPTFYNMTEKGIIWSTEAELYGKSEYKPDQVIPPPNWKDQYPEDGYATVGLPDLHTWEAFQVWMRTAGLPTFSKLAMRNDNETLKAGTYRLKIYDSESIHHPCWTRIADCSQRVPRGGVRWHQVHPHLHPDRHGWQERLPRHCVHCRRGSLHPARRPVHGRPPDQAEVRRERPLTHSNPDLTVAAGNSATTPTCPGITISPVRRQRPGARPGQVIQREVRPMPFRDGAGSFCCICWLLDRSRIRGFGSVSVPQVRGVWSSGVAFSLLLLLFPQQHQ